MNWHHKLFLWVLMLVLLSVLCLNTGTATGDPLIITVQQASAVDTLPSAERMEKIVENEVELLKPVSPAPPTGLDEQLRFIPEPSEDAQIAGQIERRGQQPGATPEIASEPWQPWGIVEHRYSWPPDEPSRIIEHRYSWPPDEPSRIVEHRYLGLRKTPSLIVVHRYRGVGETPSLIVVHR